MSKLMRKIELLLMLAILGVGGMGLSACEEGAFEETGEEIDEAGDEIEDGLE